MRPAPALRPRRCCRTGSWQLARLARRVLDALGYGVVDVFGVSWGGGLAQQFAAQYPRRCRRLVLAATAMGALMLPGKPSVLWQMISPRRYWDKDHLRRIAPQIYGGALRHDRGALRGHVQAMRGGTDLRLCAAAARARRLDQPAAALADPPADAGARRQRRSAGAAGECALAGAAAAARPARGDRLRPPFPGHARGRTARSIGEIPRRGSAQSDVMTTGQEALQRLREGNERFASEANSGEAFLRRMRRAQDRSSSRSRSRSSSAAPIRACRSRSCSTRTSATCS